MTAFIGTTCPRELRVLNTLLRGPLMREQVDSIACASNGPDIVFRLRRKGARIVTTMIPCRADDGTSTRHGRYSMTAEGRKAALAWLREGMA